MLGYRNIWGGGYPSAHISGMVYTKQLERVTKVVSKIINRDVNNLTSNFEIDTLVKFHSIVRDPTHPLHASVILNDSGRVRPPRTNTSRFRKSFLPNAIIFLIPSTEGNMSIAFFLKLYV